jgi:hypothetical protein
MIVSQSIDDAKDLAKILKPIFLPKLAGKIPWSGIESVTRESHTLLTHKTRTQDCKIEWKSKEVTPLFRRYFSNNTESREERLGEKLRFSMR